MENKMNEEKLKEYAKEFAEGSDTLEQILLNLWQLGIQTFACCKGFKNKEHNTDYIRPYIAILITPETIGNVQTFMRYLETLKITCRPNMVIIKDGPLIKDRTALCVDRHCLTNSRCQKVLDGILMATESMKKQEKLPSKSKLDSTFELMQSFIDRDLVFFEVRQAKINCSHLRPTPSFELGGSTKLKFGLTEETKERALNEWESYSFKMPPQKKEWTASSGVEIKPQMLNEPEQQEKE